jgi:hypothetical protein
MRENRARWWSTDRINRPIAVRTPRLDKDATSSEMRHGLFGAERTALMSLLFVKAQQIDLMAADVNLFHEASGAILGHAVVRWSIAFATDQREMCYGRASHRKNDQEP